MFRLRPFLRQAGQQVPLHANCYVPMHVIMTLCTATRTACVVYHSDLLHVRFMFTACARVIAAFTFCLSRSVLVMCGAALSVFFTFSHLMHDITWHLALRIHSTCSGPAPIRWRICCQHSLYKLAKIALPGI